MGYSSILQRHGRSFFGTLSKLFAFKSQLDLKMSDTIVPTLDTEEARTEFGKIFGATTGMILGNGTESFSTSGTQGLTVPTGKKWKLRLIQVNQVDGTFDIGAVYLNDPDKAASVWLMYVGGSSGYMNPHDVTMHEGESISVGIGSWSVQGHVSVTIMYDESDAF